MVWLMAVGGLTICFVLVVGVIAACIILMENEK